MDSFLLFTEIMNDYSISNLLSPYDNCRLPFRPESTRNKRTFGPNNCLIFYEINTVLPIVSFSIWFWFRFPVDFERNKSQKFPQQEVWTFLFSDDERSCHECIVGRINILYLDRTVTHNCLRWRRKKQTSLERNNNMFNRHEDKISLIMSIGCSIILSIMFTMFPLITLFTIFP